MKSSLFRKSFMDTQLRKLNSEKTTEHGKRRRKDKHAISEKEIANERLVN